MATAAVDVPCLSTFLSLPQQTLSAVIQDPTRDLVLTVLQAVVSKAKEHDNLKADKLRLDVELENAVRTSEARTRSLKSNLERALAEVGELRGRLRQEENAGSTLEAELQSLKSSNTGSQSEAQALRSRIASLESSNRDTLALLESKSTAHDRLADELTSQHQKIIDLRREISRLEQSLQTANSASTAAKFRDSTLQQELELLRRNNEWLESELRTKNAEHSQARKEKNAKVAELQRQIEESRSTIDSLKRTENALRTRLEEVELKADQSFAKIQRLQDDAASEQEQFRKELEAAQRLAELFEDSAKTTRERLQDVQASVEQIKDDAAEEVGRFRAEVETERSERETAERRASELEVQVERLEANFSNRPNLASAPGTPQRRINGSLTPMRDAGASPGSSRIKGNLNFTQMYTEYTNAKAQLEVEKRRNEKLSATIDDIIQDLESKQPEIEELRAEHERLESEMVEMTSLLDTTGKDRDRARKDSRKWEGQVQGLQREGELLRQQLRDLSTQVKVLLTEVHARDEGLDALQPAQQMELERMVRGEFDETALDGLTDTGRLISQRLTIFKNVRQLQDQNTNLLRLTRELGDKMEGEEAMKQHSQQTRNLEELEELRQKVEKYEDDLKSMITRSESYLKERDMFRRMLQYRGQLPPDSDLASLFGQSVTSEGPNPNRSQDMGHSSTAAEVADLSKLLKDMQTHFDSYREEAATDHRALKDQSDRLSREKNELQVEVARNKSQVSLARERLEMLQSNYNMLKTENSELQKRSNHLAESAAKQDLRTQQVAEELIESKSLVDSMQKDIANLKAEKDLWKRIENRLMEDNEALVNERNRLTGLITSLQNLQNERELSDSETRRRLQTQVENYTSELQAVKRKLSDETEDSKKASLRREFESQEHQKIVDDLRAGLATVKEELVAAQTTRDHLQARVDELTIELRGAQERSRALQPRTSSSEEDGLPAGTGSSRVEGEEQQLDREQELSVEVAELRRDLELAKSELEKAKDQIEQYRAISQSSEEEAQSLSDTYDRYRDEVDRLVAEKDAKLRDLEHTVEKLRTELLNTNAKLSELDSAQAEKTRKADEEKRSLEAEIIRLRDEYERYATTAKFHQEDLKAQAEIAQQAQQNYETELLKHAEAAKSLQELRKEHNMLRTEIVQLRTDAEAARAALSQSQGSWEETTKRYDGELNEMKLRRDDVNNQNNLLHRQLEAINREIADLRQRRSFVDEGGKIPAQDGTLDHSQSELREIITFLRRDKEIVDVQYELSVQESRRLKQQLDHVQSQLDDCRLKLDQERRAHAEGDRMSITHHELLQKINELNLYRESTVTLRNEAREAQAQLAEKAKKVEELLSELQPLRANVQELENEKETLDGEMKLLKDDRDRWQQRTQNILQKYDRVDPAEMEALKERLVNLQTEQAQLLAEKQEWQPLKEQVDNIPQLIQKAQEEAISPWRERSDKQVAQWKERSRALVAAKNEKIVESQKLASEKEEIEQQLSALREEVQQISSERDQALAKVEGLSAGQAQASETQDEGLGHDSHLNEATPTLPAEERQALEERAAAAERLAREQESRVESLQSELSSCQSRILELERQLTDLRQTLDEANARVVQLQVSQPQHPESEGSRLAEELERLQQDLMNAQQKIDDLQTNAAVAASINSSTADDSSKTVAEQISEQVGAIKQDLDLRHAERVQQAEDQYKQRADRMKNMLTKRLTDGKEQIRQSLEAEHTEALETLKKEHQEEIQSLNARHAEELDRVKKEEEVRLEQEKHIGLTGGTATSASEGGALNTTNQHQHLEAPVSEWNLSEGQLRELARINPVMQGILRNNISTQTKKVKEEQERLAEEKLKEAISKSEKEKEQAVAMEAQRQKVKLSMAEGKARMLAAKTDIVQKAATDTPQRSVSEVWEVAKVAKPAPISTLQPAAQPVQAASTAPAVTPFNSTSGPPSGTDGLAETGVPSQPNSTQPLGNPSPTSTVVRTSHQLPESPASGPTAQAQPQEQSATQTAAPSGPVQAASSSADNLQQQPSANQKQETSLLPPKPPQGQPMLNSGTGPGALQGIMAQSQSMLPRAPSGAGRGGRGGRGANASSNFQIHTSGLPSAQQEQGQSPRGQQSGRSRTGGRGRGSGRGAANTSPNTQFNTQLPGPGQGQQNRGNRGNLNAAARQFIPGSNKRPREGSVEMNEEVSEGSSGKRPRGGGRGS